MSTKGAKGAGEILLYQTDDGQTTLDVKLQAETVWLSLNQMADLFSRDKSVISRHLGNIFKTDELNRESTVAKFATVQQEGAREVRRRIDFFNLDAIISVGYRVNSIRGTQFRIWATHTFVDGNKRIGAFLFLVFLPENEYLVKKDGSPKINDNALVALSLLIAESEPSQKDLMVRLVINLLAEDMI